MGADTYLSRVVSAFADVMQPLADSLTSQGRFAAFLSQLGWKLDPGADMSAIQSILSAVVDAINALKADTSGGAGLSALAQDVQHVVASVAVLTNSSSASLPNPLNKAVFWQTFPDDVIELLLYRYLGLHQPFLFGVLSFLGVLTKVPKKPDIVTGRQAYERMTVDWGRLPKDLTRPSELLVEVYGWGAQLDHQMLMTSISALFQGLGASAPLSRADPRLLDLYYDPSNSERANIVQAIVSPFQLTTSSSAVTSVLKPVLVVLPIPPENDPTAVPEGLALLPFLTGSASGAIQIRPGVDVTFQGGFDVDVIRILVRPSGVNLEMKPPIGDLAAKVDLHILPSSPLIVAGDAASTHFEVSEAHQTISLTGPFNNFEFKIECALDKGKLVLDFSDADGFLRTVLGSDPQAIDLSPGLSWSSLFGFRFLGQGTLVATLPIHLDLAGVLSLETISIEAGLDSSTGAGKLSVGLTGGLTLGPIAVAVDRVGLAVAVEPRDKSNPGNLGLIDFGFAFRPPNGLGLSIDAAAVAGGGFILFDQDKGEYAGFLDICIAEIIQVKFIAILDTKLPDGSKGFSLLIIIFMELPPIQLGFGFTLNGVGGVAGVNRTMSTVALQAGLRNHTLDYVINPPQTVADAPKVISAVSSFFPPAQGRYLFGPILALGWETFIQLTIGVILEVPDPIKLVLLGIIDAGLPEIDEALIKIHIDILGILDFGKKKFSLDGSMYDSYVLEFPIKGDLALRVTWGETPNFLFSLGGFNPNFNTTGLDVPQLQRLSISIGDGDNPRIIATSYLALTSNTAQFGANVEAWASAGGFSVHGYLGFDVLFIFSPHFAFEFDFAAGFDVSYQGANIAGLKVTGVLTGTNPWHLHGEASLHILFFDVGKSVDFTWGDPNPPALPQKAVLADLLPALKDPQNWNAVLPDGTTQGATLSVPKADQKTILVHPMGTLRVIEKVVPLDLSITRYNSANPSNGNYFSIGDVQINGQSVHKEPFKDYFAAGQFIHLSDSDKLSRSSFEGYNAGVKIASSTICSGADSARAVTYDEYYIDDPVSPLRISPSGYTMPSDVYQALSHQSAGYLSPLKNTGLNKYKAGPSTPAATAKDPAYVIASVNDLSVRSDIVGAGGTTYYQARAALNSHLASNPHETGNLQILPIHEVTP